MTKIMLYGTLVIVTICVLIHNTEVEEFFS